MSERVPAWAESDERYPEREAEWRAAIARAERAERVLASLPDCASRAETAELALGGLLARAERAEAGLAALRAEIERLTTERIGERVAAAEAERDTLAAALAELREIHAALVANAALPREAWSEAADAKHADLSERLDAAMADLPADLAADAFRRARAEALEAAADAIERGSVLSQYGAHGWLRARAADERGGR